MLGKAVGRSAMYIEKSVDARIEPWGTPLAHSRVSDEHWEMRTKNCLLVRKAVSQLSIGPSIE